MLDTRGGVDPGSAADRLAGGCTTAIALPDGAAPFDATAVALNVTAVGATAAGYVTVFPCAAARPLASNLNPRPGSVVGNLVVVGVGADRRVCVFSSVATHLVVDATGWFGPSGQPYHAGDGRRVVDTRTITDRGQGPDGRVTGGAVLRVDAGVPAPATAVAANVTIVDAVADGYAVAYPCGARPSTSSVPVRNDTSGAGDANEPSTSTTRCVGVLAVPHTAPSRRRAPARST